MCLMSVGVHARQRDDDGLQVSRWRFKGHKYRRLAQAVELQIASCRLQEQYKRSPIYDMLRSRRSCYSQI